MIVAGQAANDNDFPLCKRFISLLTCRSVTIEIPPACEVTTMIGPAQIAGNFNCRQGKNDCRWTGHQVKAAILSEDGRWQRRWPPLIPVLALPEWN